MIAAGVFSQTIRFGGDFCHGVERWVLRCSDALRRFILSSPGCKDSVVDCKLIGGRVAFRWLESFLGL